MSKETREALLGWAGTLFVGTLAYLILTSGPTDAEKRERAARYAEQQAVREDNARIGCAAGVVAACRELR